VQNNPSTHLDFPRDLLEAELSECKSRILEVQTKLARLPYRKTFDEF